MRWGNKVMKYMRKLMKAFGISHHLDLGVFVRFGFCSAIANYV